MRLGWQGTLGRGRRRLRRRIWTEDGLKVCATLGSGRVDGLTVWVGASAVEKRTDWESVLLDSARCCSLKSVAA